MKLSENFSLSEFTSSITANDLKIDNTPPDDVIEALKRTAQGLERIRERLGGAPIRVTSGFRCPELNAAVKGSPRSQHVKGEAADFQCPRFGSPRQIVLHLEPHVRELGIDQIICEGTWVHVSFSSSPRAQVLSVVSGRIVKGVS